MPAKSSLRYWKIVAHALALSTALVVTSAPLAQAEDVEMKAQASPQIGAAQAYLGGYLDTHPRIYTCTEATMGFGFRHVQSHQMTSDGFTFQCGTGGSRTIKFRAMPRIWRTGKDDICVAAGKANDCLTMQGIQFTGIADLQQFADAWAALSQPRPLLDPATDTAFQSNLARARAAGAEHGEDMRRAELQGEALLGAKRDSDAADVYRAALEQMPEWGGGHYNLALVSANLGLYEEAITEMRRYLYVAPDAADARAAKDQIYKWEALLPPAAKPH